MADNKVKAKRDSKGFKLIPRTANPNVKKAEINLAKQGVDRDKKGIKFSSQKGTKTFISNRKSAIRKLNRDLGYSESDEEVPNKIAKSQSVDTFKLPPIDQLN
mgnify:CR=1 FL=1